LISDNDRFSIGVSGYIIEVFINKNSSPLFRPIPITKQEADAQEKEENMTKVEILLKIEILLEQLDESV